MKISGFLFFMNRKTAFALVLGLVALTGAWILRISTPFGLGLTDDAISYIAASRALLAGQGFTRIWLATGQEPITHWPPAFPATLAFISSISNLDPYRSARILNGLIFGLNAALLAFLGYKMTKPTPRSDDFSRQGLKPLLQGTPYFAGIFLAILFLSNAALLRLHAQALSEPLYLFISLLAFLSFTKSTYQENGEMRWLFITGILAGLSYLIRYAAFSLIATFIVAIFILAPTWHKRVRSLFFFLAGAFPFIFGWMLRNKLIGGSTTNRRFEWHPVTIANAQRGIKELYQFLIPPLELYSSFFAFIISVFITLALLIWLLPRSFRYFFNPEKNESPAILPFINMLYIFGYMGLLLVSLSFFDAATPLNDRILSPVYLSLLIIFVYFLHKIYQEGKMGWKIVSVFLTLFLLSVSLIGQMRNIANLRLSATGFASWRWQESPVMAAIRDLPENTHIHTNQPPAVYFWTNRPAYRLWNEQPIEVQAGDNLLAIFFPPDKETPEFQAWFSMMTEGLEPIQKSGLGNLYQKKE